MLIKNLPKFTQVLLERGAISPYNIMDIKMFRHTQPKNKGILIKKPMTESCDRAKELINSLKGMPRVGSTQFKEESPYAGIYDPSKDSIKVVFKNWFNDKELYYKIALHELAHSTGHFTRLNRMQINSEFKVSELDFITEELISELAAEYIGVFLGLSTDYMSIGFIKYFLDILDSLGLTNPVKNKRLKNKIDKEVERVIIYLFKSIDTKKLYKYKSKKV